MLTSRVYDVAAVTERCPITQDFIGSESETLADMDMDRAARLMPNVVMTLTHRVQLIQKLRVVKEYLREPGATLSEAKEMLQGLLDSM